MWSACQSLLCWPPQTHSNRQMDDNNNNNAVRRYSCLCQQITVVFPSCSSPVSWHRLWNANARLTSAFSWLHPQPPQTLKNTGEMQERWRGRRRDVGGGEWSEEWGVEPNLMTINHIKLNWEAEWVYPPSLSRCHVCFRDDDFRESRD